MKKDDFYNYKSQSLLTLKIMLTCRINYQYYSEQIFIIYTIAA